MEGAFCVCRVRGIVHEASEEGRLSGWGCGGPRTSFATQAAYDFHCGAAPTFICDKLQMMCNSPTIDA